MQIITIIRDPDTNQIEVSGDIPDLLMRCEMLAAALQGHLNMIRKVRDQVVEGQEQPEIKE